MRFCEIQLPISDMNTLRIFRNAIMSEAFVGNVVNRDFHFFCNPKHWETSRLVSTGPYPQLERIRSFAAPSCVCFM